METRTMRQQLCEFGFKSIRGGWGREGNVSVSGGWKNMVGGDVQDNVHDCCFCVPGRFVRGEAPCTEDTALEVKVGLS